MPERRRLAWEGCANVRDLGGLRTRDGRVTRHGRVVRAGTTDALTPAGWAALSAHGVRTIVDLRNDDERGAAARPNGIATVHVPLDGIEDREFWDVWQTGPQFGTPLYYRPHLERFPERSAAALSAIARARPGAVLVHCAGGRDRTGQVTMLLLALVGVAPEEIAADYVLSTGRDDARIEAFLTGRGTTAAELLVQALDGYDVEARMRAAGLTAGDVDALRRRLLD